MYCNECGSKVQDFNRCNCSKLKWIKYTLDGKVKKSSLKYRSVYDFRKFAEITNTDISNYSKIELME